MNSHISKATPTWGIGVPKDSQIFREWLQRSKPIGLKSSLYHWKVIETYMSKMGLHHPFGHLKHKSWPKERMGVKLADWLLTTKSREWLDFLACKWHATYRWKALHEGYNFDWELISIRGLHTKLWGSKVAGVLILVISGLPYGNPKTKNHLDVGLVERHKIYYKGEGGGFPQIRAMVSLVSSSLPVVRPSTKSAPTLH
jgi:hypothetical protein